MLAEIAMKNYLKQISKRSIELKIPKASRHLGFLYPSAVEKKYAEVKNLDLKEAVFSFEKAKRLAKKTDNDDYYLFSRITLDYTVPTAFQGTVALISDLDGRTINNIYNTDSNYKVAYLHICIFPFDYKTEILLFTESVDKRYRSFYKSFRKLSLEEQLSIINYIIFSYTEDYFLSKYLNENIFLDEKLKEIVIGLSDAIVPKENYNLLDDAKEKFDLRKHKSIVNLLMYEYSTQNSVNNDI